MATAAMKQQLVPRLCRAQMRQWMSGIDAFLFDCDGVLWRGGTALRGAASAVRRLQAAGKKTIFVTNNSVVHRREYVKKFERIMGMVGVAQEQILGSAYGAALYLRSQGLGGHHHSLSHPKLENANKKKVFVVGESGILEELAEAGIATVTGAEHAAAGLDPEVAAVVVGLDRALTYEKLAVATAYLRRRPEVLFVATNTDAMMPIDRGIAQADFQPGAGALVAAIETGSGHALDARAGKPAPLLLEVAAEAYGLELPRTCMVGDRLDTDMAFGLNSGLQTLLVLSGVTQEHELRGTSDTVLRGLQPGQRPHHVLPGLAELDALLAEWEVEREKM